MRDRIPETDWKLLRELHPIALERFCERVLAEIGGIVADERQRARERYAAVFKLVKRRDSELAVAFDDLRRTTAMLRLACIQSHGLWTDEELARFSSQTREVLREWLAER